MTAFSFLAMYLSDSCGSGAEAAGYPGLAAVSTSVVVSLGGKGSGSFHQRPLRVEADIIIQLLNLADLAKKGSGAHSVVAPRCCLHLCWSRRCRKPLSVTHA
jgi:hypothetical protein